MMFSEVLRGYAKLATGEHHEFVSATKRGRPRSRKEEGKAPRPDFTTNDLQGLSGHIVSPEHTAFIDTLLNNSSADHSSEAISSLRKSCIGH
jgi:hypothetical protein